jgi:hypothetical protein
MLGNEEDGCGVPAVDDREPEVVLTTEEKAAYVSYTLW